MRNKFKLATDPDFKFNMAMVPDTVKAMEQGFNIRC